MRLLGNFPSKLNSYYYQNLLDLTNQEIAAGEFSGGTSFDATAVAALQAQGQDFTTLSLPSAGSRVLQDSLNTPLNILAARYAALLSEVSYYQSQVAEYSDSLVKQLSLLDQLLAYTNGIDWSSDVPQLDNATSFSWNFEGGYSAISADISPTDPTNGTLYRAVPLLTSVLNTSDGTFHSGISVPTSPRTFVPKNLTWIFSTAGTSEISSGADWTDLGILEAQPRLIFADQPVVQPPTAANLITVSGSVAGGTVPIYVNLQFVPRSSKTSINLAVASTLSLTPYRVEPENTSVVYNGKVFDYGVDFTVTADGFLTSVSLPAGVDLDVYFQEYFPAYQCSVNQEDWSQIIMLDPVRPYPDTTTNYVALGVKGNLFPLTDESGVFTGLYIQLAGIPANEMVFSVTTPASEDYGMSVQLQVDMERPAYMTGLSLSPYTTYPQILKQITCQSVTGDPIVLFNGSVLVDRQMVLSFPRTSVRLLTLSFVQENYTIKQYEVALPDKLRRDTLTSLQSVLPFSIQTAAASVPTMYQGTQYQFGFEDISGVDWSQTSIPAVFVTGPYRAMGIPDAIRTDVVTDGTVDIWLYSKSYSSSGHLVDTNSGLQLVSGSTIPAPATNGVDRTQIAYTDFYLKFILRSTDARIENFFLQVSHV